MYGFEHDPESDGRSTGPKSGVRRELAVLILPALVMAAGLAVAILAH